MEYQYIFSAPAIRPSVQIPWPRFLPTYSTYRLASCLRPAAIEPVRTEQICGLEEGEPFACPPARPPMLRETRELLRLALYAMNIIPIQTYAATIAGRDKKEAAGLAVASREFCKYETNGQPQTAFLLFCSICAVRSATAVVNIRSVVDHKLRRKGERASERVSEGKSQSGSFRQAGRLAGQTHEGEGNLVKQRGDNLYDVLGGRGRKKYEMETDAQSLQKERRKSLKVRMVLVIFARVDLPGHIRRTRQK